MPIYQYQCSECGHRLEALQKMSDAKLTDCPECGKAGLRKQITAAAFKLKGTGWYETDFKNSGKPPASQTEPSASKKEPSAAKSEPSAAKTEPSASSSSSS